MKIVWTLGKTLQQLKHKRLTGGGGVLLDSSAKRCEVAKEWKGEME